MVTHLAARAAPRYLCRVELARRLVACLLALTIALEATAAASAVEWDGVAHCCCGDHDVAIPCDCPDCPRVGHLRLVGERPAADHSGASFELSSCYGKRWPHALPAVWAGPPVAPFLVVAPAAALAPLAAPIALLPSLLEDPPRPPS